MKYTLFFILLIQSLYSIQLPIEKIEYTKTNLGILTYPKSVIKSKSTNQNSVFFNIITTGEKESDNSMFNLEIPIGDDGKIKSNYIYKVLTKDFNQVYTILTLPGLKATIGDEREIAIIYKTNYESNSINLKNLYRISIIKVYGKFKAEEEKEFETEFQNDFYINIDSILEYHNYKKKLNIYTHKDFK